MLKIKFLWTPFTRVRWFWRFRFDSENYFRAGSKILLIHTVDFKDSRNEYEIKTNTYQQIIMIKSLLILVLLTLIACNATKPVIVTKKPLKPKT
jgi:hypothetical protein